MATEIDELTRTEGTDQSVEHGGVGTTINTLIRARNARQSGFATILLGTDAITIPAATLLVDEAPAVACLNTADATALYIKSVVWTAGDLVITANANATADTIVTWMVDGAAAS